jgi:hypothetical protein
VILNLIHKNFIFKKILKKKKIKPKKIFVHFYALKLKTFEIIHTKNLNDKIKKKEKKEKAQNTNKMHTQL